VVALNVIVVQHLFVCLFVCLFVSVYFQKINLLRIFGWFVDKGKNPNFKEKQLQEMTLGSSSTTQKPTPKFPKEKKKVLYLRDEKSECQN
jgi:hypothetical protein